MKDIGGTYNYSTKGLFLKLRAQQRGKEKIFINVIKENSSKVVLFIQRHLMLSRTVNVKTTEKRPSVSDRKNLCRPGAIAPIYRLLQTPSNMQTCSRHGTHSPSRKN